LGRSGAGVREVFHAQGRHQFIEARGVVDRRFQARAPGLEHQAQQARVVAAHVVGELCGPLAAAALGTEAGDGQAFQPFEMIFAALVDEPGAALVARQVGFTVRVQQAMACLHLLEVLRCFLVQPVVHAG
ncbi:hypothetical protein CN998_32835, partial [Bacillus cereus]